MSIGNFDGMHLGHAAILARLNALQRTASVKAPVAVVTFEPHPLTVLKPEAAPPRLTPAVTKRALLDRAGVDFLIELAPDRSVLDLSAEAFWNILKDDARPSHLVEGPTFYFGKDRQGTLSQLSAWTKRSQISLDVVDAVRVNLSDSSVVPVSSSLIRFLIAMGRARDAAVTLGRPYVLVGTVVQGYQRGRTIGVPTANLDVADQLIPADGVYTARCSINERIYPVALSIGSAPTFGVARRQVEAHIMGFSGDLYGQTLAVELLDWVREQRKYNGVDALKSQIARDLHEVQRRCDMNPAQPVLS